jgi:phosphatidylserine/phosphatidylglycerophosphate/cardiolipin synthase-like enzyme
MPSLFTKRGVNPTGLLTSQLYDNETFYKDFIRDLNRCKNEVIIESPFITSRRITNLLPTLQQAIRRGVEVVINTRDPIEHDLSLGAQATDAITELQRIGVEVLFTGSHHRKLAIFDRRILWEGSLNILSQNNSCEIMRRIQSPELAMQMIIFTKLDKFLK